MLACERCTKPHRISTYSAGLAHCSRCCFARIAVPSSRASVALEIFMKVLAIHCRIFLVESFRARFTLNFVATLGISSFGAWIAANLALILAPNCLSSWSVLTFWTRSARSQRPAREKSKVASWACIARRTPSFFSFVTTETPGFDPHVPFWQEKSNSTICALSFPCVRRRLSCSTSGTGAVHGGSSTHVADQTDCTWRTVFGAQCMTKISHGTQATLV